MASTATGTGTGTSLTVGSAEYLSKDTGVAGGGGGRKASPTSEAAVLTEQEVRDYTGQRLARYKHLVGGVRFIEELPRNPSKKILKSQLRAMAQREIGAKL